MDANNPYRGRRGLRFGKSGRVRVVRGFARGGAVSLDGLTRKASREHDKITEEAFRDSDGVCQPTTPTMRMASLAAALC